MKIIQRKRKEGSKKGRKEGRKEKRKQKRQIKKGRRKEGRKEGRREDSLADDLIGGCVHQRRKHICRSVKYEKKRTRTVRHKAILYVWIFDWWIWMFTSWTSECKTTKDKDTFVYMFGCVCMYVYIHKCTHMYACVCVEEAW